jgi:predicted GNAT superfamily acetyltransferase
MEDVVEPLREADFQEIVRDVEDFWGEGRAPRLLHPMFVYEFGDTAFVVREDGRVAAYLLGFVATASPTAYIHLVAVRGAYRGRGLARRLYDRFLAVAKERGATRAKAITNPWNRASIAFHERLGFHPVGDDEEDGVPVVRAYSGPGVDRVVLLKEPIG